VSKAFAYAGIELEFRGLGADEKAYVVACHNPAYHVEPGSCVVEVDPRYFRPTEVDILLGDASKARQKLGWKTEYSLDDLVADMMQSDLRLMQKEQFLKDGGFSIMNYYE
jgi:GDPmannose 4,6-dehydratase